MSIDWISERIILDKDIEKIILGPSKVTSKTGALEVTIQQGDFWGKHKFILPAALLKYYYENLSNLYETLDGEFTVQDDESLGHITFSINSKGHLLFRAWLGRWEDQTYAEFWIHTDQTVLNSFLQHINCMYQRILTLKNT